MMISSASHKAPPPFYILGLLQIEWVIRRIFQSLKPSLRGKPSGPAQGGVLAESGTLGSIGAGLNLLLPSGFGKRMDSPGRDRGLDALRKTSNRPVGHFSSRQFCGAHPLGPGWEAFHSIFFTHSIFRRPYLLRFMDDYTIFFPLSTSRSFLSPPTLSILIPG